MKRGVKVLFCLSLILILSFGLVSAGFFGDIIKKVITGKVVIIDLTPRISYWCGKVNQHTENGVWKTDPDGKSNCYVNKLDYCKKFYGQGITSYKEYANETIATWRNAGNIGEPYSSTKQSYECIQEEKIIGVFWNSIEKTNYSKNGVYTNYSHSIFMKDYEQAVKNLSALGLNTIIFEMDYMNFHFRCDKKLSNLSYPINKGFNESDIKQMVRIARENNMNVIPSLQILTHQGGNVLSVAYPEYMLSEENWTGGRLYSKWENYVEVDGQVFRCKENHFSAANNKPIYGDLWRDYWDVTSRNTRDPFNIKSEQLVFNMIDELINAFTINGIEPEGFHIASDELSTWINCPEECNGMNNSETFAMPIINVYNHIKKSHPDMDVIMWGDMLDEKFNGGRPETPVAGAIDFLPKDIIINDWKYFFDGSHNQYLAQTKSFISVGRFMDKGFEVLVSPWYEEAVARDLIWTGKKEDLRTGNFKGVIYTIWGVELVPHLNNAINNQPKNWADLILIYNLDSSLPTRIELFNKLATVFKNTPSIVNNLSCRGEDSYCGAYPKCEDCKSKDGYYKGEYRVYHCMNNICNYSLKKFPRDYVSYWKFEDNVIDEVRRNNGQVFGNPKFIRGINGKSLLFDGNDDYVLIKDSPSLDMTNSTSISLWFKTMNKISPRVTLVGKHYLEYELNVYENGCIHTYTSNGMGGYDEGITLCVDGFLPSNEKDWINGKWYHLVWTLKNKEEKIYVNGVYIGNYTKSHTGIIPGTHNLEMGRRAEPSASLYFNGSIDEVMIFNRVLSQEDITMIYKTQKENMSLSNLENLQVLI